MPTSRRRVNGYLVCLVVALSLVTAGCNAGSDLPAGTPTPSATSQPATPPPLTPTPTGTPPVAPTPHAGEDLTPFATVVPDWIEGLGTQSESRLRDPYDYFAAWPYVEGYPRLEDGVRAEIERTRRVFDERVGDPVPGSPIVQELNISFEFLVASGDVVGVRLQVYEFFGAGGADLATTVWFDTAADQQLPATALLDGPAALERVAELTREALRRDRPDLSLPNVLEEGTAPSAGNYDSMGFTPGGDLLVEFDEYQVGPGASGAPRVVIPAAVAEPLLSDFGRRAREQVLAPFSRLDVPVPTPTPTATPSPSPTPTATATATASATPTPSTGLPPGAVDCARVACVALTFDDGPGRPTARLLDVLGARGARATFFVIGANVPYNPALLGRMVAEGHEVGNHTLNHRDLTKLSGAELLDQIVLANDAIEAATGRRPRLLRPPYGAVNERTAAAAGMPLVLWSVDPRDWADHDAGLVARRIATDARAGSIVLLHDIHESTVDAIPAILDDFDRRGLTLVTVTELLGAELVVGRIYRSR